MRGIGLAGVIPLRSTGCANRVRAPNRPTKSPQSVTAPALAREPFAAVELRLLSKVNSGHPGADFHLAATGSQLVPFRPRMRDGHGWPEVAETIGPAGALARMMRKVRVGRRRENEWQPRSYNP